MPLCDLSKSPDKFAELVSRRVVNIADMDNLATLFNEAFQGQTAWDNAVTAFTNALKARGKHLGRPVDVVI